MMLASSGMPWVSTIPLPFVGSISASILDYIPKSLTSEGFNAFVSFVTGNAENLSVKETILGILFMASAAFLLAIILGVIFIFLGRGDAGFMSGLLGLISVILVYALCESYMVKGQIFGSSFTVKPLHLDVGAYIFLIGSLVMAIGGFLLGHVRGPSPPGITETEPTTPTKDLHMKKRGEFKH